MTLTATTEGEHLEKHRTPYRSIVDVECPRCLQIVPASPFTMPLKHVCPHARPCQWKRRNVTVVACPACELARQARLGDTP